MENIAVILGDPRLPDPVKPNGKFNKEDIETVNILKRALAELNEYQFIYLDNHIKLREDLEKRKKEIHLALNLCDEGLNNNPKSEKYIPLMLELRKINYTGANLRCIELCFDKDKVLKLAKENDILIPESRLIKRHSPTYRWESKFPVIVKPNYGDGSFGINQKSVILDQYNLDIRLHKNNYPLLVQEFLPGNELTVGIIGNKENYKILPIIEEDYSRLPEELPKICGYEAKWDQESPYWKLLSSKKSDLSEKVQQIIIENSIKLFELTNCRDYARIDWRLDQEGNPRLLEVNPNCGWCNDGHLAKMANLDNISYPEMLNLIIKASEKRLY
ncbi:MAG: ATP-grasp domain-containing protein [Candidatus Nanoarchaeia archaeon]|nr:ATP-grasp domain-containing protein [Candidatus Nanoarchaeia archaeon]